MNSHHYPITFNSIYPKIRSKRFFIYLHQLLIVSFTRIPLDGILRNRLIVEVMFKHLEDFIL